MSVVKVTRILLDQDLRSIHKLRAGHQTLRKGACFMAFNKAQNMVRIVDCEGGVHSYWSPDRQLFDIDEVQRLVMRGWNVELDLGRSTEQTIDQMWELA